MMRAMGMAAVAALLLAGGPARGGHVPHSQTPSNDEGR